MSNSEIQQCYLTLAKERVSINFVDEVWKEDSEARINSTPPVPAKMDAATRINILRSWDVDLPTEQAELAIGSALNGGDICPHRGIWSCSPAPLKGPQQRIISTGARLFNVLAKVPAQKPINQLLGRHYLAPVPTEWILIAYLPEVRCNQMEEWDIEEEWLGLAHPDLIYPIG